jgi:hypothetical protein
MPSHKCKRYNNRFVHVFENAKVLLLSVIFMFLASMLREGVSTASYAGVKVGDKMKYDVTSGRDFSSWFFGAPSNVSLEWVKVEVVAANRTEVTLNEIWRCVGGQEYVNNSTVALDTIPKCYDAPFLISADMRVSQRVCIWNWFYDIDLEGTAVYAGSSRVTLRLVFESQGQVVVCDFDKQTGFLLEARVGSMFEIKAAETNMWSTELIRDWKFWTIVVVAIIFGVVYADAIMYRRKRREIDALTRKGQNKEAKNDDQACMRVPIFCFSSAVQFFQTVFPVSWGA